MLRLFAGIKEILILGKGIFSFLLCFVLAVILLHSSPDKKQNFVDASFSYVLFPAQYISSKIQNIKSISDENSRLKLVNSRLRVEYDFLKNMLEQQSRIEKLNSILGSINYQVKLGEVIAKAPGRYQTTIVIDKGWKDSVLFNMAVATSKGIVGRISKSFYSHSHVKLLRDPVVRASVIEGRTRNVGILESPDATFLRVEMSKYSGIKVGDTLYTSGYGGVFPKGLRVGTIEEIEPSDIDVLKYGKVKTFQNLDNIEDLFVIIKEDQWSENINLLDSNYVDSLASDTLISGMKR